MLEKIREIMLRYVELEPEQIQPESNLAGDLALTSFSVMSMMGDFEDEFGITVDETELTDIYTVGDIMDYIKKKQAEDSV